MARKTLPTRRAIAPRSAAGFEYDERIDCAAIVTWRRTLMALFVRPTNWVYDQPLFRSATDDEDGLEAMLAAIALEI